MAWIRRTLAAYASLMMGVVMSGCCCGECFSQDAQEFMTEGLRSAPSANVYLLNPDPLQPNGGNEDSQNNRLVMIRGKTPGGDAREFDVFFGPGEAERASGRPGKGRFVNADPGWECTQGYAVLRGIRPLGTTQYVKATSDSTTIIILVSADKKEERFLLTEGATGAKVYPKDDAPPAAANLQQGYVIVATIKNGKAMLGAQKKIADDPVSVDLLAYLEKVDGAQDLKSGK